MRTNNLRTIWQAGGAAVNGWLAVPNSFSAEVMAHQGWDTLTIDLQHGVVDYQAMVTMLQAISTTPTVPVVRVPWLEPGILMKALDAGAYGVICPMVNTREEAQKLVAWTTTRPRAPAASARCARSTVRRRRLPGPCQPDHRALRDDRNSDSSAWASWARPWRATCSPPATSCSSHPQQAARRRCVDAGATAVHHAPRWRARPRSLPDGARHARRGGRAVRRDGVAAGLAPRARWWST
jgi:hypothetical protein